MGFSLLLGAMALPTGNTTAPQPVASVSPTYQVALTAYNAVPEQTSDHPLETASGAYSNPEIIAARSQDFAAELPFGTIIELDGSTVSQNNTCGYSVVAPHIGYRVIEDTMNARYTNRIDVLLDTKTNYTAPDGSAVNAATVLGICKGVTIKVVGYVGFNHLPKTQAELAAMVEKNTALALN
jgi:3D (Asp-Asp-Asp) domain-containing protein